MRVLVLGTTNEKKRLEIEQLLALPVELRTLRGYSNVPEVVEDGETFLENAAKKAVQIAQALGEWVLGEDSGLVVDALGGAPGIYSARYAGEPCDDQANNDKLLRELRDVPPAKRTAHYVCTIVVSDPQGIIRAQSEGRCDGHIAEGPSGSHGFGYDPLFIPQGYEQTFGQIDPSIKQKLSHRAAAIAQLRPQLQQYIG